MTEHAFGSFGGYVTDEMAKDAVVRFALRPDGTIASHTIPLSMPELGGNEDRYVLDALARNELAVGSYIPRFELAVADYMGVRHAVAVSSGTAALHLALLAAGVGPGDEVLVPSLTFAATAFAVSCCGATPVFVDVELEYWQMDPRLVQDVISYGHGYRQWLGHGMQNKRTGAMLRAILPVSLLGHPSELSAFAFVAGSCEMALIHDAAEAIGATHDGKPAAIMPVFLVKPPRRQAASLACLSFNATKTITAAGGGMVLTDDANLAERVRHLANQAKVPGVEMEHDAIGFNYRMSNLQAAIGCAQMERIDEFLAKKRAIAERYARELADVPGITMQGEAPWARSSWWLSTILVDAAEYGMSSRELLAKLADAGIQCRPLFMPLHLHPVYAGREQMPCPVAERLWKEAVSLPSSVGLSEEDQKVVVRAIKEWCNAGC